MGTQTVINAKGRGGETAIDVKARGGSDGMIGGDGGFIEGWLDYTQI